MRIRLAAVMLLVLSLLGAVFATGCQPNDARRAGVVSLARSKLGKPYVFGANGPTQFDCQGLVWYVFHRYGVTLPHGATAQYYAVRHVTAAQAGPGDLVFFHKNNDPTGWYFHHVGIVSGPNQMVNALGTRYGVVTSSISAVKDRNGWVAYGRVF